MLSFSRLNFFAIRKMKQNFLFRFESYVSLLVYGEGFEGDVESMSNRDRHIRVDSELTLSRLEDWRLNRLQPPSLTSFSTSMRSFDSHISFASDALGRLEARELLSHALLGVNTACAAHHITWRLVGSRGLSSPRFTFVYVKLLRCMLFPLSTSPPRTLPTWFRSS